MDNIYEELDKDYPTEIKADAKVVKTKTPRYVLPLALFCIVLAFNFLATSLFGSKDYVKQAELETTNSNVYLLKLMHNENFASVKKSTGASVTYIEKNWTIKNMPVLTKMTPEVREMIINRYFFPDSDRSLNYNVQNNTCRSKRYQSNGCYRPVAPVKNFCGRIISHRASNCGRRGLLRRIFGR